MACISIFSTASLWYVGHIVPFREVHLAQNSWDVICQRIWCSLINRYTLLVYLKIVADNRDGQYQLRLKKPSTPNGLRNSFILTPTLRLWPTWGVSCRDVVVVHIVVVVAVVALLLTAGYPDGQRRHNQPIQPPPLHVDPKNAQRELNELRRGPKSSGNPSATCGGLPYVTSIWSLIFDI